MPTEKTYPSKEGAIGQSVWYLDARNNLRPATITKVHSWDEGGSKVVDLSVLYGDDNLRPVQNVTRVPHHRSKIKPRPNTWRLRTPGYPVEAPVAVAADDDEAVGEYNLIDF